MPSANTIISEQEKRISFFLILHKYNTYFMLCKYKLLWHILFYLFSLNIQPRGLKIHEVFFIPCLNLMSWLLIRGYWVSCFTFCSAGKKKGKSCLVEDRDLGQWAEILQILQGRKEAFSLMLCTNDYKNVHPKKGLVMGWQAHCLLQLLAPIPSIVYSVLSSCSHKQPPSLGI